MGHCNDKSRNWELGTKRNRVHTVLPGFIAYICRTLKGNKDLRLSSTNKRYHVRPVLLGMIYAVCIRWLFTERSYIERYLMSPFKITEEQCAHKTGAAISPSCL